jgi:phosphotriesterase-related protein
LATVQTARGPVDSSRLGTTLMHEHIFVLDTEVQQNYPDEWGNEETRVADAVKRLNELRSRGVDTIVDLTVLGLGRCIPRIWRIATQTKLQIIVATGLYTYRDLPHYFHLRLPDGASGCEPLLDMFVRDIREGIAGTSVKAGVLKCCTDEPGLTPDVERILRAVARAHRQTGVPISTHTHAGLRRGLDQQRIFREEGVDLTRVVIGHCGDTTDVEYLEELVREGSYLGMDRFGVDTILDFTSRVNTVAAMCERGHANKMVLSHDSMCYFHWMPELVLQSALPRWNYLHIHNDVLPALRQKGVSKQQLQAMLVDNPRRIFEEQTTY